jgi:hypothetical protein
MELQPKIAIEELSARRWILHHTAVASCWRVVRWCCSWPNGDRGGERCGDSLVGICRVLLFGWQICLFISKSPGWIYNKIVLTSPDCIRRTCNNKGHVLSQKKMILCRMSCVQVSYLNYFCIKNTWTKHMNLCISHSIKPCHCVFQKHWINLMVTPHSPHLKWRSRNNGYNGWLEQDQCITLWHK